MDLLWGTIQLRPYVFVFLAFYLLGASLQFGAFTALLFLPVGYLLAFLSELASIHWGFPYGDYYYITATADREIWVLGVPLMDSLSYVFLSACSYATALFLLSPFGRDSRGFFLRETRARRGRWVPWILAGLLMVLLDIVIDPLALRGDRWFLGEIYGYRSPGYYFGVPLSNFGGWLLVGLMMIKALQGLLNRWGRSTLDLRWRSVPLGALWGPTLYVGILIFNLVVTFAIGEFTLGLASLFLTGVFLVMGGAWTIYKVQHPLSGSAANDCLQPDR